MKREKLQLRSKNFLKNCLTFKLFFQASGDLIAGPPDTSSREATRRSSGAAQQGRHSDTGRDVHATPHLEILLLILFILSRNTQRVQAFYACSTGIRALRVRYTCYSMKMYGVACLLGRMSTPKVPRFFLVASR